MSISEKLVEFCYNLKYDDLPENVIDMTKYYCLDFLGLASRGSTYESSLPVISLVKKIGANGTSVVMGTDILGKPEYACFANGIFAHSLELDDVVNEASLHPAVAVFPVAFAAGEMVGAKGKDIIPAAVAGYEIMIRLGRALNPTEHYKHGFHPTGTCGTFAAAITAGIILGLDRGQLLNAIGIANSQASGSMEFLTEGAWTKRFHPGWSSHSGLLAALLAKEGFIAPKLPVEGKFGFLKSYSDNPSFELAEKGLGDSYLIMTTSIKPHACCRYKQSPIDAILKIVTENDIKPEQVQSVKLYMVKTAFPIVVDSVESKRNPQSIVDAQFSMYYGAAVSIVKRKAFIDEYQLDLIASPQIRELMQKVECYNEPGLDVHFPRKWPCRAEITTMDGKKYEQSIEFPKGDPENALSWEELITKFNALTEPIYSAGRQQEIVTLLRSLEDMKIPEFSRLLHKE